MFKKIIIGFLLGILLVTLGTVLFTFFFDQAVIVRKGTIYHVPAKEKLVALTFDDGPSPLWTPRILGELKKAGAKATFFMIGEHVAHYPQVARQVVAEGHEIGNHGYHHKVVLYYTTDELKKDVEEAETIIKEITGVTTKYFRPPKAWLRAKERKELEKMGYKVILWSLNSKDWVTFDDKYIRHYILKNVRPGDIILFHDSGGVFSTEGGSRKETVLTINRLVEQLKEKGYRCVTISELLQKGNNERDLR